MKFFPTDWLADCSVLSLAAKGAWQTLLCKMWHPSHQGQLTLPLPAMARLLGATPDEAEAVLCELSDLNIGEIERDGDNYTVISRRMVKDWEATSNAKADVSEARSKAAKARWEKEKKSKRDARGMQKECTSNANKDAKTMQNDAIPEARSQSPDKGSSINARGSSPPSLEEAQKAARSSPSLIAPEVVEAWHDDRTRLGWVVAKGEYAHPIQDWLADLRTFARHWNNNEAKDAMRSSGSPRRSSQSEANPEPLPWEVTNKTPKENDN